MKVRLAVAALTLLGFTLAAQIPPPVHTESWPAVPAAIPRDAALERRIDALLKRMTLEQKVGQVIQPSIPNITPGDVRDYHLGSVLNGGGGWPGDVRKATPSEWLALADAFYEASMDTTGGRLAIPVMWGTDAVHGHNNIVGATLFPHNVGLGAMRNPDLIRRIGEVTAVEMRVTGQDWNFSPTVAVARDSRWGRAYESWSEDPELVRVYAEQMIRGLQGDPRSRAFLGPGKVIATAKHFIGDGGTEGGRDQGDVLASEAELRDIHGAGYAGAMRGGVQVVMASYNSWHGAKLHGVGALLTGVLKRRMGFDGIVVGDWNGHGQVTGCTNASCPQSFNAGVDIFMVPEDWKKLYENTVAQVKSGEIPRERLDDAVRRILRVKLRAGLFTAGKPSRRPHGGESSRLGAPAHRAVARQAVRESLVLLKNNGGVLPIAGRKHVLVAGDGADNIAKQSGGWTLTWQGDGNTNADFPGATSIGAGIRAAVEAAGGRVTISADGSFSEKPDVAVVVFGEDPYAEFQGDRMTVVYEGEKDLALLRRLKDAGIPVVSLFLSGRPLWVNPHLNASDAFVAAWLPGTEGGGVADVLLGTHDFKGKLAFSWPKLPTQAVLNRGQAGYDPLFPYGFGLTYADRAELPKLSEDVSGVDQTRPDVYFAGGPAGQWRLEETSSEVALRGGPRLDLSREANGNLALAVGLVVRSAPARPVLLEVAGATIDVSSMLRALPLNEPGTIRVRLRCFADAGADMTKVDVPFRMSTEGELAITLTDVRLVPVADAECP
ncbi:MAG TPA: glycoside hydrolase family 3 N-terminal domain-containing protein [Thermoanaerobaculia bacterium]|nr:glycoside hydrolase family 3 N-terminal domain-containing protein [Thermoanaerobaculia bacterium]